MEPVTLEPITLERAVEVVRALTPAEQQQLRKLMDSWPAAPRETTKEQQRRLAEALLAKGLLTHIPQDAYTEAAKDRHEPIQVAGRPVSETLLEDRE